MRLKLETEKSANFLFGNELVQDCPQLCEAVKSEIKKILKAKKL